MVSSMTRPECCDVVSPFAMQEFVHALRATSKRASREDRLRLIFAIFDVDNDGVVSAEDLELMVRQLAGSSLS